jgi:hypothetical protein
MNSGRRRSQALTVTILKRHERSFAAAERSGARSAATRPGPIEIAQDQIAPGK